MSLSTFHHLGNYSVQLCRGMNLNTHVILCNLHCKISRWILTLKWNLQRNVKNWQKSCFLMEEKTEYIFFFSLVYRTFGLFCLSWLTSPSWCDTIDTKQWHIWPKAQKTSASFNVHPGLYLFCCAVQNWKKGDVRCNKK